MANQLFIKVRPRVPNHLSKLLSLKSQLGSTQDSKSQQLIALKAAELVLPIFEFHYPNDRRVRNGLKVVRQYLETGEGDIEKVRKEIYSAYIGAIGAAYYAATAAYHAAAASAATYAAAYDAYAAYHAADDAYYANAAINRAIISTKRFFNIKD